MHAAADAGNDVPLIDHAVVDHGFDAAGRLPEHGAILFGVVETSHVPVHPLG
jgi:hypothetical protein